MIACGPVLHKNNVIIVSLTGRGGGVNKCKMSENISPRVVVGSDADGDDETWEVSDLVDLFALHSCISVDISCEQAFPKRILFKKKWWQEERKQWNH